MVECKSEGIRVKGVLGAALLVPVPVRGGASSFCHRGCGHAGLGHASPHMHAPITSMSLPITWPIASTPFLLDRDSKDLAKAIRHKSTGVLGHTRPNTGTHLQCKTRVPHTLHSLACFCTGASLCCSAHGTLVSGTMYIHRVLLAIRSFTCTAHIDEHTPSATAQSQRWMGRSLQMNVSFPLRWHPTIHCLDA